MLTRRKLLTGAATILAGSFLATAEAGKGSRRIRCDNGGNTYGPTSGIPKAVQSTCLLYKWFDNGSYCSWYAIQCDDAMPSQPISPPINYDGDCGLTPASPCTAGCIPFVSLEDAATEAAALRGGVHPALKNGYMGGLLDRSKVPAPTGTARIVLPSGTTMDVDIANSVVHDRHVKLPGVRNQVRLLKVTTRITTPFSDPFKYLNEPLTALIGHEIRPEANPGNPQSVSPHGNPTYTEVALITYVNEIYTVVMKR